MTGDPPWFQVMSGNQSQMVPVVSLRDQFAMNASPVPDDFLRSDPWTGSGHLQCRTIAGKQAYWAYQLADAMLAERDRSKGANP